MTYNERVKNILEAFNLAQLTNSSATTDLDSCYITQADLFEWICIETMFENDYMNLETFKEYHCDGVKDAGIDFIISENIVGQVKDGKNLSLGEIIDSFLKARKACESLKNKNYKNPNANKGNISSDVVDKFNNCYVENEKIIIYLFYRGKSEHVSNQEIDKWIDDNENEDYSFKYVDKSKIISKLNEQDNFDINYKNSFEIKIDNNLLQNNNKNLNQLGGIVINISVYEIFKMFEKNAENLFEKNVRNFIKGEGQTSKVGEVNNGIKKTLKEYPDFLWFVNNGLVILTEDFVINLNKISLTNFSVINGAQTVNNIFLFLNNLSDFEKRMYLNIPIMCKIIKKPKDVKSKNLLLFNNENEEISNIDFNQLVIKSTNTQKPIQNWTFFSSEKDVIEIHELLQKQGIYLKIKDGVLNNEILIKYKNKILKLPDFTQYAKSVLNLTPGKSMQRKNKLFLEDAEYKDTFKIIQKNNKYIKIVLNCIEELEQIKEKFKEKIKYIMKGKQWIVAYLSYKKIKIEIAEKLKKQIISDNLKYIPTDFEFDWDTQLKIDFSDLKINDELNNLLDLIAKNELSSLYKDDNFVCFIKNL